MIFCRQRNDQIQKRMTASLELGVSCEMVDSSLLMLRQSRLKVSRLEADMEDDADSKLSVVQESNQFF
jgi:hypothetical protein